MKIIVGGAGHVGRSIVGYLSRGRNDIIVVDTNQEHLNELSREFDIQTVNGSISRPDIQEKIGASSADMLIAATDNDEVNLVACQVGYTLFNIPKKIARVDSEYFLSPLWNTLFNEKSLPIDLVISPDAEIAAAILRVMALPGSREAYDLADGRLIMAALKCAENCTVNDFTVGEIYDNFGHLHFAITQIVRQNRSLTPKREDKILCGDEIYLLMKREDAPYLIHAFGGGQKSMENVLIFGGNAIAYDVARHLEKSNGILDCRLITNDARKAGLLADVLERTAVIHGEMMSDVILEDAGIDKADVTIAVTSNDKDNLLASLLAKHNHICSTISLVNSRAYDNLIDNIGDNILIDRSSVTISKMLQDIRQANLSNAYSLGRGFAEIWEVKIDRNSLLIGKAVAALPMSERSRIFAVVRGKECLFEPEKETILENDTLIVFVVSADIRKTEHLFG
jgi:trk system potassium uptake protein TrkA